MKGVERKLVMNSLHHLKPFEKRAFDVLHLSLALVERGSLDNLKSDSVYRKIRSEMLLKNDKADDDIVDLIYIQRENKSYIRQVGVPFHVYIARIGQIKIDNKQNSIFY